eukprot:99715-Rhodomonas_salina.1
MERHRRFRQRLRASNLGVNPHAIHRSLSAVRHTRRKEPWSKVSFSTAPKRTNQYGLARHSNDPDWSGQVARDAIEKHRQKSL